MTIEPICYVFHVAIDGTFTGVFFVVAVLNIYPGTYNSSHLVRKGAGSSSAAGHIATIVM
jgi:hypothetical protein